MQALVGCQKRSTKILTRSLQPIDGELYRRKRLEGELGIGQHHLDHALDQVRLDSRVWTALHANGALTPAATKQHVDNRID